MKAGERTFGRAQLRDIGRQIRLLRERSGQSLSQLAKQSGISVTGVRNIESGRANPGLLTVVAILDALDVSIDEVVALARRASNSVHVTRATDSGRVPDAGVQRNISEIFQPKMRGRLITLPPATDMLTSRKAETGTHFAFVLEGKVHLSLPDGSSHELSTGDAIHLADQAPRVVANRGKRAGRVLWIKDQKSGTD